MSRRSSMTGQGDVRHAVLLKGHAGATVTSLDYSMDSCRLASASKDHMVLLFDVQNHSTNNDEAAAKSKAGRPEHMLKAHKKPVRAVRFLYEDQRVASGGDDGMVHIWDVFSDGKPLFSLQQAAAVRALAVMPAGSTNAGAIVVASGKSVGMWDAELATQIGTSRAMPDTVMCVAVAGGDTNWVASGCRDGSVQLWDSRTNQAAQKLVGHTAVLRDMDFCSDGSLLATASGDKTARVWDVRTRKMIKAYKEHTDEVSCIQFSPDDTRIITASHDASIHIWDHSPEGTSKNVLKTKQGEFTALRVTPNGNAIATACRDGIVRLWRPMVALNARPSLRQQQLEEVAETERLTTRVRALETQVATLNREKEEKQREVDGLRTQMTTSARKHEDEKRVLQRQHQEQRDAAATTHRTQQQQMRAERERVENENRQRVAALESRLTEAQTQCRQAEQRVEEGELLLQNRVAEIAEKTSALRQMEMRLRTPSGRGQLLPMLARMQQLCDDADELTCDSFEIVQRLGVARSMFGSSVVTYLARFAANPDVLVALKVAVGDPHTDMEQLNPEVALLDRLPPHSNIVRQFKHFSMQNAALNRFPDMTWGDDLVQNVTLCSVSEPLTTSLREKLEHLHQTQRAEGQPPCPELLFCHVMVELLSAVVHLQRRRIVHRDIRLENIMVVGDSLNDTVCLKLANFGFALKSGAEDAMDDRFRFHYTSRQLCRGGNPQNLLAPEVLAVEPSPDSFIDYTKTDVFAVGTVAYKMLCGVDELPFGTATFADYSEGTFCRDALNDHYSPTCCDFVWSLLQPDPAERCAAEEALLNAHQLLGMVGSGVAIEPAVAPPPPTFEFDLEDADIDMDLEVFGIAAVEDEFVSESESDDDLHADEDEAVVEVAVVNVAAGFMV